MASCFLPLADLHAAPQEKPSPPDFTNDVLPVLTRHGCNTGACHGAALGQKEFKLSLLGGNPRADWEAITREFRGRRISRALADESLILLKPSERVPHKGGRRLPTDSEGYAILRRWIEAGAPFRTEKRELARIEVAEGLRVTAHYSDGSARDVTKWAVFTSNDDAVAEVDEHGRVTMKLPGETAILVRYGGHLVAWRAVKSHGAGVKFERRNAIDEHVERHSKELGIQPGPPCDDATFLRRAHLDLIGTLPTPDEVRAFLAKPDRDALVDRLLARPEFAAHWTYRLGAKPDRWDAVVRGILTTSVDFYRVDNPETIAENAARRFLGMRIQCAQCHNHPFERFTQDDYYGLAAFFARTRIRNGQIVTIDRGDLRVPPAFPGGVAPRDGERRLVFAEWVTGNRQFARALVNRLWAFLIGRGLVDPVDDFRTSNPPSNGPLLEDLAAEFEKDYSIPGILRRIATSNAYACLREPRLLDPPVYLDAVAQATGVPGRTPIGSLDSLATTIELIAGPTINAKLPKMADFTLEEMYLRTLSRFPTKDEIRELRTREEREDFLWALLNSKEFLYGR